MEPSNEYVLLPGPDRLADRILPRDQVQLQLVHAAIDPEGVRRVQAQIDGGEQELLPFVIPVTRVPQNTLKEYARSRRFHTMDSEAPIDHKEPLVNSGSALYIATADGKIYCLRTTVHQGKTIAYAQKHPLTIGQPSEEASRPAPRG